MFVFKKAFVEEMVESLKACIFAFCEDCIEMNHHTCRSPLWAVTYYWKNARYFFNMNDFFSKLERLYKLFNVEGMRLIDMEDAFEKADNEWEAELQAMAMIMA